MKNLLHAFEILNVEPGSDDATLRKAWRALVRTYHPDMARTDPVGANQRLAQINAAWDLVSSSTEEDIRRVKALIAQRRDAAARRQQATNDRRRRAQAAFEAAEQDRLRKKAKADAKAAALRPDHTGNARGKDQCCATDTADVCSGPDAVAPSQIAMLARRAFKTAQVVCSSELRSAPRAVYM